MLGALLVYKYHCCLEHWIGTKEIRRKIKQSMFISELENELKTETDHTCMHKTLIPPHDSLAGWVLTECRANLFIVQSVSADEYLTTRGEGTSECVIPLVKLQQAALCMRK